MRMLPLAILLIACSATASEDQRLPINEIQDMGTELTNWFYGNELDSLFNRLEDRDYSMRELAAFREKVADQLGEETETLVEIPHAVSRSGTVVHGYVRHSRFSKTEQPVYTGFAFDYRGSVYSFEVRTLPPEAPTEFSDYCTKTRLRLPFDGDWHVSWGGRTVELNQHAVAPDQRFAYDFLVKKEGYSFRGNGARNEDYYCYNLEILAPGDGRIVFVENGIPDNRLGDMPAVPGNTVIIDHRNGEFSVLAHLKQGSIVVGIGDDVVGGQLLGCCGNSGHSSEPHLHYHLQDSPTHFEGNGLPAQFELYEADGHEVQQGEPLINQSVRHKVR